MYMAFDPTAATATAGATHAKSHAVTGGATAATAAASAAGSTTITGSDFLTLLVTEMKNQDPTQPTDPAQYVQQLVGVNSLEQLININTQLTSLGGSTTAASTTTSSS